MSTKFKGCSESNEFYKRLHASRLKFQSKLLTISIIFPSNCSYIIAKIVNFWSTSTFFFEKASRKTGFKALSRFRPTVSSSLLIFEYDTYLDRYLYLKSGKQQRRNSKFGRSVVRLVYVCAQIPLTSRLASVRQRCGRQVTPSGSSGRCRRRPPPRSAPERSRTW